MLQIGNIRIESSLLLAPLAGITDLPFRMINREHGCQFAFIEMISARSLVYQSSKTLRMIASTDEDRPLGIQLLGNEIPVLEKAVDLLSGLRFDLIDFNAACPVQKVTGKNEGAALLKDPPFLGKILKALVERAACPVTLKIRSGWNERSINAADVARYAEDAGISSLCIHGRTREQGYSGDVDYDAIAKVKQAVAIPVIGSGNALSPALIKKMLDETGCDGVSIARGSLGNPWIFREAEEFLRSGTLLKRPPATEIREVMLRHLDANIHYYGEKHGTMTFRKFFSWYTKSLNNIKRLRERSFHAETRDEMAGLVSQVAD
ncbi:MAG: tRNA dihydrouridine synthase DusB [Nitrospirae bacterium]|nr:MAG: tRNA dihydrouridine synthase DusB [Nitrospirota bacterium]